MKRLKTIIVIISVSLIVSLSAGFIVDFIMNLMDSPVNSFTNPNAALPNSGNIIQEKFLLLIHTLKG
jgi:hypothetical protein